MSNTLYTFEKTPARKKGIAQMWNAALALVVLAFVLVIGQNVLQTLRASQSAGTYALNATEQAQQALNTFANYLIIVALVIVGAVVIGILVKSFSGVGSRGT